MSNTQAPTKSTAKNSPFSRPWAGPLGPVAWTIAVLALGFTLSDYIAGVGATVGIMALLALGMVLVTGYAGQFSLAVGAFYGIGAYASALLTANFGVSGLLAIIVGATLAAMVAYALGRPIFRLRGHFLAMATLALTEGFFLLVNSFSFTGASSGLAVEPLNFFGRELVNTNEFFILNWVLVGLVVWGCLKLSKGREGRALKAIRGHEAAAASAGIDIASSKTRIFTASAIVSSIGGSLYAHQVMYVNPPPFGASTAIDVLVIAVLGGLRTPWGAVVGAIGLEVLNQFIEATLPSLLGSAAVGAGQTLFLGLLLVIILVARPDGIAGAVGALARRLHQRKSPPPLLTEPEDEDGATSMSELRRRHDSEHTAAQRADLVPVLEARHVIKKFGGVTAVHDISLTIGAGEVLAVIGPNGAGKSTLVNLLSGNLPVTGGSVILDGEDVTGMPAFKVARHGLARTFQTPCLFEDMDVAATVKVGAHLRGKVGMVRSALPTPGAVKEEHRLDEEAGIILRRLGLAHLAHLDAKNLSMGQQKRIEIARALAGQPKVILLDEPCAGLNKAEKKTLMRLLRQLAAEGLGVLVIEHDMEFVMASADRVHVINFGETLSEGSPSEVQADPAVIAAYLGVAREETIREAEDDTTKSGSQPECPATGKAGVQA